MENKKLNVFTLILVIFMCVFTIFISTQNVSGTGKDGQNGNDLTLLSIYQEYKKEMNYTGSFSDFIDDYIGEKLTFNDETTQAQISAGLALCSTVDICYSYYMDAYYLLGNESTATFGNQKKDIYFVTRSSQPLMSVSAGSGVIYKMETSGTTKTAYIITNYHVAYVEAYSNDPNYNIFYNQYTGEYISSSSTIYQYGGFYNYIIEDEITEAPTSTHFLDSYNIYLNGYQSKDNALSATFVGGSSENDIAVLKIEYDSASDPNNNNKLIFNGNYISAEIGDSDDLHELDYVIPVGNPLIPNTNDIDMSKITTYREYIDAIEDAYINSLCLTTTGGRVSSTTCEMPFTSIVDSDKINNMRLVQVDAAINPGNSGGGLYDLNGKLVGIVNGKVVDTNYDNVGFAIPINIASRIADQIITQCDNKTTSTIHRLTTEELGITLKEVAGEVNKPTFNVVWNYVYDIVVENDPSILSAAYNKLKAGDIIKSVKFAGEIEAHNITRDYQLDDLLLLAKYPTGSEVSTTITLKIVRDGTEQEVALTLSASDFVEVI